MLIVISITVLQPKHLLKPPQMRLHLLAYISEPLPRQEAKPKRPIKSTKEVPDQDLQACCMYACARKQNYNEAH